MTQFLVDLYVGFMMRGDWDSFLGSSLIGRSFISSRIQNMLSTSFQCQNKSYFRGPENISLSSVPTKGPQKFVNLSESTSSLTSASVGSLHNIFIGCKQPKKYNCLNTDMSRHICFAIQINYFHMMSIRSCEPQVD